MDRKQELIAQYNEMKNELLDHGADTIKLLCVSKTYPWEDIQILREYGVNCFGENRAQEAVDKFDGKDLGELELHFIGHLQRNKVKTVLPYFSWIDSVDSLRLVKELAKHSQQIQKSLNILFEMNTSGEIQKFGLQSIEELEECIVEIQKFPTLIPRGLMTVGPLGNNSELTQKAFHSLKVNFDFIEKKYQLPKWDTISMGMSDDFIEALDEGSTMVRIGTRIFGRRNYD